MDKWGEMMATHYKGERIDELLGEIATIQAKLDQASTQELNGTEQWQLSTVQMTLALRKAQLTSLRGEHGKD